MHKHLACSICGGEDFEQIEVLWPALIRQWQLADEEVEYVNRQQGKRCRHCGANLRIVVLGQALQAVFGTELCLRDYASSPAASFHRLLDINGAEAISLALSNMPAYVRGDYPEVDMHDLPYEDGSFDVIIHSDTLEHVANPEYALKECRRVMSGHGKLCFTIPMIVGRLSRSRAGLPPSYHGDPMTGSDDFRVQTEFGADAWLWLMKAGFTDVHIRSLEFPAAHAFTAS